MPAPAELFARLRAEYSAKGAKFLAVSAFNVVFGQSLLLLANVGFGWAFVPSNLFAVSISALPAYILSRYWVWQKKGKNHFWKEVVPFWSLALLGLLFSTLLVAVAENFSTSTLVLMATNFFAFGCVWVAKFFILDRVLFKDEPLTDDALDIFVDEALHPTEGAAG